MPRCLADAQKLITDVFNQKFTDNTNTKSLPPFKTADGTTAVAKVLVVNSNGNSPSLNPNSTTGVQHIDGPPQAAAFGGTSAELDLKTGDTTDFDTASGKVNFVDINAGDLPSVSTKFASFTYQDAQHNDVTTTLNAQQLADIAAVEVDLVVVSSPTPPGLTTVRRPGPTVLPTALSTSSPPVRR